MAVVIGQRVVAAFALAEFDFVVAFALAGVEFAAAAAFALAVVEFGLVAASFFVVYALQDSGKASFASHMLVVAKTGQYFY